MNWQSKQKTPQQFLSKSYVNIVALKLLWKAFDHVTFQISKWYKIDTNFLMLVR